MRSVQSVGAILGVGVWLGGIPGCGPALLMNTPVSKTADGWEITLRQVKEGPDEYIGEGGILVAPGDGQKLVWALVTVRNGGAREDEFSYDTCVLSGPGQAFRPLVVDRHADPEVNSPADKVESFAPGREITRQLVFPYPKEQRPSSVKCGAIALPIRGSK